MYATLNQHQPSTLISNTIKNPYNNGHYLAIMISSGKMTDDSTMNIVVENKVKPVIVNDEKIGKARNYVVDEAAPQNPLVAKKETTTKKGKEKEDTQVLKPILQSHPHYLYRLKKKVDEGKYHKFYSMLNKLLANVSLVEDFDQMLGYMKFMR